MDESQGKGRSESDRELVEDDGRRRKNEVGRYGTERMMANGRRGSMGGGGRGRGRGSASVGNAVQ